MKLIKSKKDVIAGAFILFFFYALFIPTQMTRYTLSDGNNTVVFQSMVHIAEARFYKDIEKDAQTYVNNGYTFLYEGVRQGKVEKTNKAHIPTFSIEGFALGISSQNSGDYFDFVKNNNGIDADVDTDWVLDQFQRYSIVLNPNYKEPTKEDIQQEITFIKNHKTLISIIGKPILRISLRFGRFTESIKQIFNAHTAMDEVILVERNKVLYSYIKSNGNKIYINYGANHFENLYALMKADNSNWHIVEIKNFEAF